MRSILITSDDGRIRKTTRLTFHTQILNLNLFSRFIPEELHCHHSILINRNTHPHLLILEGMLAILLETISFNFGALALELGLWISFKQFVEGLSREPYDVLLAIGEEGVVLEDTLGITHCGIVLVDVRVDTVIGLHIHKELISTEIRIGFKHRLWGQWLRRIVR